MRINKDNSENLKQNIRSGFRKIHNPDGIWQYKIGNQKIVIFSPENKKILTDQSEVTGMSWDDIERGYHKEWFKGITPKHIKNFINKLIQKNKDILNAKK